MAKERHALKGQWKCTDRFLSAGFHAYGFLTFFKRTYLFPYQGSLPKKGMVLMQYAHLSQISVKAKFVSRVDVHN